MYIPESLLYFNEFFSFIQRGLYDETFRDGVVVDSVLEDFNVTISSYGQIGMGKTFTMEGQLLNIITIMFDKNFISIPESF